MSTICCPVCGKITTFTIDDIDIELLKEIQSIKKLVSSKTHDQWLDMRGVCSYTSLSESTIRRAIVKGTLKHSNSTGKLLFKISSVDRFLEKN
ncbi:MAG: helix-turn-helix domain-containing protein [Candidatus Marinimicrobia bacterium]|nr:helix-turn-helix domain-containing protein [Candidatus Neomarinimicrobiota bacterium]